jgi:hypothetical protein
MGNLTPFSKLDISLPLPDMSGKNPFLTPAPGDVPADAPEGSYTYAPVQSAPSVPPEECEVAAAAAEIVIRWGATTLHVAHLAPPRAFRVGEASDGAPVDFSLPAEKLGVPSMPVLLLAADGSPRVVIPPGAKGTVTVADKVVAISDLAGAALAAPSSDVTGAFEVPLREGTRARFEIGGIELSIASVHAGKRVSGRFSFDRRGLPFQAVSMALHLGLLGAAAVFMPPMALASEDSLSRDRIEGLRTILSANAEVERDASKSAQGQESAQASGPVQDSTGRQDAKGSAPGRKGGSSGAGRESPGPQLSREETIALARGFGMVDLLRSSGAVPVSPWGNVEMPSRYSPKADLFDGGGVESGGNGVLALSGVGEGSDTDGRGFDLSRIGTRGLDGTGGVGSRSLFRRGHTVADPSSMRATPPQTLGRIPSEVIQRVVRQNFGKFRACFESGLRRDPSLAGRVSVRFVIGRDGGVMSAASGGSDLPDPAVVSCVVAGFRGLQFPQAEDGGTATVVYPILFSGAR